MKKLKSLLVVGALLILSQGVLAEVSWDQVKSKIKKAQDYTVNYHYEGPNGNWDFDYRYANKGANIRTEIVGTKTDKSKVGTVIVFDKAWNADKIRAKTGGGLIIRNLSHADVQGRPFHEGVFQKILSDVGSVAPSAKAAGSDTIFTFAGGYRITANSNGEIVETRRVEKGKTELRQFDGLKWNTSPNTGFKG